MASVAVQAAGAISQVAQFIVKGLFQAAKALFIFIYIPFQWILGFFLYDAERFIYDSSQTFFPSKPIYTDPQISATQQLFTVLTSIGTALGTIIRQLMTVIGPLLMAAPYILIAGIAFFLLSYIIMLITPQLILIVNFLQQLFINWFRIWIIVWNTIIRPVLIAIAPIWNEIIGFIIMIVVAVFHVFCPGPTYTANPAKDCPLIGVWFTFLTTYWKFLIAIANILFNFLSSIYVEIGNIICPGGNCGATICVLVNPTGCFLTDPTSVGCQCSFGIQTFTLWVVDILQQIFTAVFPYVQLIIAFTGDMLNILLSALAMIFVFPNPIADEGTTIALINGTISNPVQLADPNSGLLSQLQYGVISNTNPLGNYRNIGIAANTNGISFLGMMQGIGIIFENVFYIALQFIITTLATVFIIIDTIICNIFHNTGQCLFGKLCYFSTLIFGTSPLNVIWFDICVPLGWEPITDVNSDPSSGTPPHLPNKLTCPCDRCLFRLTPNDNPFRLFVNVAFSRFWAYTDGFVTDAQKFSILVPCMINCNLIAGVGYSPNELPVSCNPQYSILEQILPF